MAISSPAAVTPPTCLRRSPRVMMRRLSPRSAPRPDRDLADRCIDELRLPRQRVVSRSPLAQGTQFDAPTNPPVPRPGPPGGVLDLLPSSTMSKSHHRVVLHDLNLACRYADHLVAIKTAPSSPRARPADVITTRVRRRGLRTSCRILRPVHQPHDRPVPAGHHDRTRHPLIGRPTGSVQGRRDNGPAVGGGLASPIVIRRSSPSDGHRPASARHRWPARFDALRSA